MTTTETVCKFHQTGFCKFTTQCRKFHSTVICPNNECADMSCTLRHPRRCKYFFNFGRCKFNSRCAYSHDDKFTAIHNQEIAKLKVEIQKLEMKIQKLNDLETKLSQMEVKAIEKEEDRSTTPSVVTEEKVRDLDTNFYILMHAVDDLERTTKFLEKSFESLREDLINNFKCQLCAQVFINESHLRNHIRNQHGIRSMT